MDNEEQNLSIAVYKPFNSNIYRLMNGSPIQQPSGYFEIRLFYVRITPCAVNTVPDHLTLRNLRREIGVSLEINGVKVPSADTVLITLKRDRVDKESSEVTYVSTDNVRVSGAVEFEVIEGEEENEEMVLCGSLERMESTWTASGNSNNNESGWSMDFYTANGGSSSFLQPKLGISSPSIEVYIAGCCSAVPVILTKTIQISPRRRVSRHGMLDAIPEDEETEKEQGRENGFVRQRKMPISEAEVDEYESDGKVNPSFYSDEMYYGEDGQLSWFNAGVRVGVGIGLGMCLGVGIGVGLLMRSYQATTHSFRRRFF